MSLSVNPVSNVSFRAQEMSAEEILSRPGMWAKPEEVAAPQSVTPKKHKFLKFVAGALITVAVVAGALYGMKAGWPKVFDSAKSLEGASGFDKFKGYLTKYIGKGGEYVESAVSKIGESSKDCLDRIANLFKKEKA